MNAPARRRDAERKRMRARVMKAAMDLFLKEGFENVSMRRIAAKIKYSPGTIYTYFENKNHIFFELRLQGFERLYAMQLEVQSVRDPGRRLRKHAQAYIRFALENPEYYRLMFVIDAPMTHLADHPEWHRTLKTFELFQNNVQAAIDSGDLHANDLDTITVVIWSFLHGLVTLAIGERFTMYDHKQLDALIRRGTDTFLNQFKGEVNR